MAKTGTCACAETAPDEAALMGRLAEVLAEQKDKPGGLIPALQTAQGIFGYLPEKVLRRIAEAFGKSYCEVAGVVSFYSFFSTVPRGKFLVRVCLGTACYVRGGKDVLNRLREVLSVDVGETTNDKMFTLEVMRCIGACGLAPAMSVNGKVYKQVNPNKVQAILGMLR